MYEQFLDQRGLQFRVKWSNPEPELETVLAGAVKFLGWAKFPYRPYKTLRPATENVMDIFNFTTDHSDLFINTDSCFTYSFDTPDEVALREHVAAFNNWSFQWSPTTTSAVNSVVTDIIRREGGVRSIKNWLNVECLKRVKFPKKTSPGCYYIATGCGPTKARAYGRALIDSVRRLHLIKSNQYNSFNDRPASLAARGKRSSPVHSGSEKEGRLILNVDFSDYLLGSMTSQMYLEFMKRYVHRENGGMLIGISPFHQNWPWLANQLEGYDQYHCLDFKSFDSSCTRQLIKAAFLIVQSKFDKEEGSQVYWRQQVSNMVDTLILDPSGYMYRKRCGIASGNPYTSIIGSYCNQIVLECAYKALGVNKKDMKIFVFGDDSIIAIKGKVQPTLDDVARIIKQMFGMTVSPTKSVASRSLYTTILDDGELEGGAVFLSNHFLPGGMPVRPLSDCIIRMFAPEYYSYRLDWQLSRTYCMFILYYNNPHCYMYLMMYFDYLKFKYRPEHIDKEISLVMLMESLIPDHLLTQLINIELPDDYTISQLYFFDR